MKKEKTYRAIRHDVVRKKQKENSKDVHHPIEKIKQVKKHLNGKTNLKILELFAGHGNMSDEYKNYIGNEGFLDRYDKKLKTGDSYIVFHELIAKKQKYDVIDIDPYGFPSRFFPDIFLLMEDGQMFITFPKPYINILNGITRQHHLCYYGEENPSLETIKNKIKLYGLCHWRNIEFEEIIEIDRLWRFSLKVKKVKATEYCGVRNRP